MFCLCFLYLNDSNRKDLFVLKTFGLVDFRLWNQQLCELGLGVRVRWVRVMVRG